MQARAVPGFAVLSIMLPAALAEPPGYAVVASQSTAADPAWRAVIDALLARRSGQLIEYSGPVTACTDRLAARMPRYTCFVGPWTECDADFVAAVNRLTRRLDGDPFGDTQWGIVTGLEPADARRMVDSSDLTVRRALNTTYVSENLFEQCAWLSDGAAGDWGFRHADGAVDRATAEQKQNPGDQAERFNAWYRQIAPDVLVTSSHGFQNAVEMPFSKGRIVSLAGALYTVPAGSREATPLPSLDGPRAFLPVGNCLVGRIDSADCMTLAMIRSAGVTQMVGYTVETWYGRAGWGTLAFWTADPGACTLSDAYFANQQQILHDLAAKSPDTAWIDPPVLAKADIGAFSHSLEASGLDADDRDLVGLMWDRDTVAFYGDPAADARLDRRDRAPRSIDVAETESSVRITVQRLDPADAERDNAPLFIRIPRRPHALPVSSGFEHDPIAADDFVIIRKPAWKSGANSIVVELMKAAPGRTSENPGR